MSTTSRKFSSGSLVACLAVGVAAGGILYAMLKPAPPPVECEELRQLAVFDKDHLGTLTRECVPTGVRFYLAKDGNYTAVAGPIMVDQSHCPENGTKLFQLFKRLDDDHAIIDMLSEVDAERFIKDSNTPSKPTWSIDVPSRILLGLLSVDGANAVALVERRTTDEDWTFDLVPVKIASGVARPVGSLSDRLVGAAPCPRFCGPSERLYLHRR